MNPTKPRPTRICTSHEMREIDRLAEVEYGLDAMVLMENAGRAAAQLIADTYSRAGIDTEILVFAGKGNNAGDAFVVARRLLCLERKVRVFHFETEEGYKGAVLKNFQILKRIMGSAAKLTYLESIGDLQAFFDSSPGPFTIIDGILGTGLRGPLEGIYYDTVEAINAQKGCDVISLDIPTGVSGDTGLILGNSVQATMTVSFGFPKLGHFLPPGATRRGDLINVDISLPPRFKKEGDKFLLNKAQLGSILEGRDRYGHKNSFGHALLIGGSPGRMGAIAMSASACHKMGTGLVTVATWLDCFDTLCAKLPNETMAVPLHLSGPEFEHYKRSIPGYSTIVVGPGLGLRPEGKQLLQELLAWYEGSLVLDADALNLIADYRLHDLLMKRKAPTVLTPHPGEMSRLLGISKDEIREDPIKALKRAVAATQATVVLKGAATLVCSSDEVLYLNHYPNDGMATAGSGDVLAGMIGGLLGQRMEPFQATILGIYLHSLAGDFAARNKGQRSMTAPDIIEGISEAFHDLEKHTESGTPPVDGRMRIL